MVGNIKPTVQEGEGIERGRSLDISCLVSSRY